MAPHVAVWLLQQGPLAGTRMGVGCMPAASYRNAHAALQLKPEHCPMSDQRLQASRKAAVATHEMPLSG